MLYNIYDRIVVSNSQYDFYMTNYSSVNIESNIETLTDTCIITIPNKKLQLNGDYLIPLSSENPEDSVNLKITIGDKINVYFDYYKDKTQYDAIITNKEYEKSIFFGYVARFDYKEDTIDIICEDSNWLFKHNRLKTTFTQKTDGTYPKLKEVIEYVVFNTDCLRYNVSKIDLSRVQDVTIGNFRIDQPSTGAEIFNQLKEDYKLYIYFTTEWNGTNNIVYLNAGLKYRLDQQEFINKATYQYPFDNQYYPIIQENLDFNIFDKEKDLAVIGTSKQFISDESIVIGTKDGINVVQEPIKKKSLDKKKTYPTEAEKQAEDALNTIEDRPTRIELNIPNLSVEELSNYVKSTWKNYPVSGLTGTIETFLKPIIKIGDIITINKWTGLGVQTDPTTFIVEKHFIDAVSINLNATSGLTTILTIGLKLE